MTTRNPKVSKTRKTFDLDLVHLKTTLVKKGFVGKSHLTKGKQTQGLKDNEYVFYVLRYKDDPIAYDMAVGKLLWTFANQNQALCHYNVRSDYLLTQAASFARPDEDSVLFLVMEREASCKPVQNYFNRRGLNAEAKRASFPFNRHAIAGFAAGGVITWDDNETEKKTKEKETQEKDENEEQSDEDHDQKNDNVKKKTRQNNNKHKKAKFDQRREKLQQQQTAACEANLQNRFSPNMLKSNVAFEIEILCAAVQNHGMGQRIVKVVEDYVHSYHPTIQQLFVMSVNDPTTLSFYKKNGFDYWQGDKSKSKNREDFSQPFWLEKILFKRSHHKTSHQTRKQQTVKSKKSSLIKARQKKPTSGTKKQKLTHKHTQKKNKTRK